MDPISRALIELSVIRGLDDGEIAGMLGSDEELIRTQREDVVREVAARIEPASDGAEIPELEAIVAGAVDRETAAPEVEPEPEPEAEAEVAPEADMAPEPEPEVAPEPEAEAPDDPLAAFIVPDEELDDRPTGEHETVRPDWLDEPEYQPRQRDAEPSSRRRTLVIVVGLVAVLAVIVGIQRAGGSGSDDSSTPTPAPSTPAPQQQTSTPAPKPAAAPKPTAKSTKLAAVGKTGATGTVAVENGRLTMDVKGLPQGTYTVWLYNSVIDSTPLKTVTGTSIKLSKKLPADAKSYKFIDVSLQPAGTANHSGESVLRTATP